LVEGYQADAVVSRDGMSATGDSIMGLLMLAASRGTSVEVTTTGPDEAELMDAIAALFADRFGEPM
jgi:phosphocarrier protein